MLPHWMVVASKALARAKGMAGSNGLGQHPLMSKNVRGLRDVEI